MTDTRTDAPKQFPVCGPRQPVYDFMRSLGFKMSNWSDKQWIAADDIQVQIYGSGSMARIYVNAGEKTIECELDELADMLEEIRS